MSLPFHTLQQNLHWGTTFTLSNLKYAKQIPPQFDELYKQDYEIFLYIIMLLNATILAPLFGRYICGTYH